MLREKPHSKEALDALADVVGRSLRTVRRWKKLDPAEQVALPGRPALAESELDEAQALAAEQLELQGPDTGEEPIWRALGGRLPRARVRRVLPELKAARRRKRRKHRERARVSVKVLARDVLWSLDATHLGRDEAGRAVQAEVLREVASTRTIGISVGPAATAEEVVRLLDETARERGGYPLVLLNDNGGAYVSELVAAWCREHGVLHLFSLPRTPQHNGASENGMHGLKLGAGLGKGARVHDSREAHARLVVNRDRIDQHRLRRTRGWLTAVQADRAAAHWSALVTRQEVLEKAACALAEGLLHCKGRRAERRAAREAILGTLQHFSVIQRTRGGQPWDAHDADKVT